MVNSEGYKKVPSRVEVSRKGSVAIYTGQLCQSRFLVPSIHHVTTLNTGHDGAYTVISVCSPLSTFQTHHHTLQLQSVDQSNVAAVTSRWPASDLLAIDDFRVPRKVSSALHRIQPENLSIERLNWCSLSSSPLCYLQAVLPSPLRPHR